MIKEAFSDLFTQKENYLINIDARIKLIFTVVMIFLSLSCVKFILPISIASLAVSALLSVKIPPRVILIRLCAPLGVTILVMLTQVFLYGTTPLFEFRIFAFKLTGYTQGLERGLLIFSRVIGAVSSVIFLSMTTQFHKLLGAMRYFKIPKTWIDVTLLTYRYIYVLFEDALTIRDAQRMRLGYSTLSRSLRSVGELAASAVIKAYDQSLAVQEAMMLRRYNEKYSVDYFMHTSLKRGDYLALGVFTVIVLTFVIFSIYLGW